MEQERISLESIFGENDVTPYEFPKYTTQIINLANQNCGGTRPSVVGQMSELMKQCPIKEIDYWKDWYLNKYPDAIQNAKEKISNAVNKLKDAIENIDDEMIENWLKDLIFLKTVEGFLFQNAILKLISIKLKLSCRLATPEEESIGIDGYIGDTPVSIKPDTYKTKTSTKHEAIDVQIIYYKKTSKYLHVEYQLDSFLEDA